MYILMGVGFGGGQGCGGSRQSSNRMYAYNQGINAKGQLISDWLFDDLNFPENQHKNRHFIIS